MVPREIRTVVKRLKMALKEARFPRCRVIVFGSYARGEARKDSDIDICLASSSFGRNKEKYRKEAMFIAFGLDPRLQIVVADVNQIRSNCLSPLYSQIRREGVTA